MNPLYEKASGLMDTFHKFCTTQGWDCYSVVFTGEHDKFDSLSQAGNDFIRQCTIQSYNSTGHRMICGLPVPESENTGEVSYPQEEKH